jgi:CxxC motif-containing protein (DUF1111 family)
VRKYTDREAALPFPSGDHLQHGYDCMMEFSARNKLVLILAGSMLAVAGLCQDNAAEPSGRVAFSDSRNPPPWTSVPAATRRDFDVGHSVFDSQWLPADQAGATRVGLGPLFVQDSCDACHDDGARGRPPVAPDELSNSFVMQLGGAATNYGHVLNTRAIEGHAPEARIAVTLRERVGRYDDGQGWTLREPRYAVVDPTLGVLPATTVLKPRIGPALFGSGLLDAVSQPALETIRQSQPSRLRGTAGGRFGWQGSAISLVDQTALAFAREMGLTSELQPHDDCTPAQTACRNAPQGGMPELSERLFHAVNTFQFLLAAPARAKITAEGDAAGALLFERTGCAACHVPRLPVPRDSGGIHIDPYTDLLLHDLGEGLADRTVGGRTVASAWRTAPLWGLGYALQAGPVALLHDGRAASIEEAILWHGGQAEAARRRFMAMDAALRRQLLDWIATL